MRFIVLISALIFLPLTLKGQGFYTEFGQNRIQYSGIDWQFFEDDNFRIYFHSGGRDLGRFAVVRSRDHIKELERLFDYNMREKVEVFVFNSVDYLRQSNLTLTEGGKESNTGGTTLLQDKQVNVYFNGNYRDFDRKIRETTAEAFINEMFYGGDVRERVQNAALIQVPYWHKQGLVRYAGTKWNSTDNDEFRRIAEKGHVFNIHYLNRDEQALAGHNFWYFIERNYGRQAIANILYMISINKNFEGGFHFVLGKGLREVENEWLAEVSRHYELDRDSPAEIWPQASKVLRDVKPGPFRINRNESKVALVTHDQGKSILWLYDINNDEIRKINQWGYVTDQLPDDLTRITFEWHPVRDELAIFYEENGQLFFTEYIPEEDNFERGTRIMRLDKVLDFDFHNNGRTVVLSGVRSGVTNIYTFDTRTNRVAPVTNDIYTDLNPKFVRNSAFILFSSDRTHYNIEEAPNDPAKANFSPSFNIYFYNYQTRSSALKRITNNKQVDHLHPVEYDDKYFGYLTNENGAYNRNAAFLDSTFEYIRVIARYEKRFERQEHAPADTFFFHQNDTSNIYVPANVLADTNLVSIDTAFIYSDLVYHYPLTNHQYSIHDYNVNQNARTVTELRRKPKGFAFYRDRYNDIPSMSTERSPIETIAFIPSLSSYWENKEFPQQKDVPDDEPEYFFLGEYQRIEKDAVYEQIMTEEEAEAVSISEPFHYPSSRVYTSVFRPDLFVGQLDNSFLSSPWRPYNPDEDFVYDPTINALMEVTLFDRFRDYRIIAGAGITLDLQGADLFASFENRKNRLNREYIYFRQSNVSGSRFERMRNIDNEFRFRATWPLSETSSVRGDVFSRHQIKNFLSSNEEFLQKPSEQQIWTGLKAEYVYDNTRSLGKNIPRGTRLKFYGEMFGNVMERDRSFTVVGGDVRNYIRLHRNLIFANRVAGAGTIGKESLVFFMGGVENWLFPTYNDEISVNRDADYSFQALATNMRGFGQNIRNGSSFAVWNSEIRWPFIQYFNSRYVRSDFLRDLQLVAFSDVGTAWTGLTPYSDENVVSQQVIERPPALTVIVSPLRSPIVWGYGGGIRSTFLGYFVKLDYGWGREGLEEPGRMIHLSFGLDF